jgi:hypothetical protein
LSVNEALNSSIQALNSEIQVLNLKPHDLNSLSSVWKLNHVLLTLNGAIANYTKQAKPTNLREHLRHHPKNDTQCANDDVVASVL